MTPMLSVLFGAGGIVLLIGATYCSPQRGPPGPPGRGPPASTTPPLTTISVPQTPNSSPIPSRTPSPTPSPTPTPTPKAPPPHHCGEWGLEAVYEWNVLRYEICLPYIQPRYPRQPPVYQENATLFTGLEVTSDRIFLATPRERSIPPATLSTVPLPVGGVVNPSPYLKPYPDLAWNTLNENGTDCNTTMVSVYRMTKDSCNRLWVLDAGVIFSSRHRFTVCPPKILIFDLSTDKLVKRVVIPQDVLVSRSLLVNIIRRSSMDSNGSCDTADVYIADSIQGALIVYRPPTEAFYVVTNPYMSPSPDNSIITIDDESFIGMYGITGLEIVGAGPQEKLYFTPVASTRIFSTLTSSLEQDSYIGDPIQVPVSVVVNKTYQSIPLRLDPLDNCLLYNPLPLGTINAFNLATRDISVLIENTGDHESVLDMKYAKSNGSEIYILSAPIQKYFNGDVSFFQSNLKVERITRRGA